MTGTPVKAPRLQRRPAPLEHAWNLLEDLCPRHQVLGFHSYLRDQEISAGRRFTIPERHAAFLAYSQTYPQLRQAYAAVFGHITS